MVKPLVSTSMSSKGQIVIPEEVRKSLNLQAGVQFAVFCEKDVVILKVLTPPTMAEFNNLVKKAQVAARKAKIRKKDVHTLIAGIRKKQ